MENNQTAKPADAENTAARQTNGKTYAEKLAEKDENAGARIKSIADKAGAIIALAAVALGFIIIGERSDTAGIVVGIMAIIVGLFASYVVSAVLNSYGDRVNDLFTQKKIQRRQEARRAEEQRKAEQEKQRNQPAAAPVQPTAADENPAAENVSDVAEASEAAPKEKAVPLLGKADQKRRHVAHFAERCRHGIICPICGRLQDANRDKCVFCESAFIFDDEVSDEEDIPEFTVR